MRYLILMLVVGLVACGSDSILVVAGYEPLEPPAEYATWYAEAEACAGASGDFESVRWFTSDVLHLSDDGHWRAWDGMFVRPSDIIIRTDQAHQPGIVRHESLHHILQTMSHDHSAFAGCW